MPIIVFELVEKGKKLTDITDYIIYSGVARLLKSNEDVTVVPITDPKDISGFPLKPNTTVYFDSHGQPGQITIGNSEDMENGRGILAVKPKEIDNEMPSPPFYWMGDYSQALNCKNVSKVVTLACSGAIPAKLIEKSERKVSICNALASGIKDLKLDKDIPVSGYYGIPLLHPDPKQPITVIKADKEDVYSELQKKLESGLLPNDSPFLVDGKQFKVKDVVAKFLAEEGKDLSFEKRCLAIAEITAPFYTELARQAKLLGYTTNNVLMEQHTRPTYSTAPVWKKSDEVTIHVSRERWKELIPYSDPEDTEHDTDIHTAIRKANNPKELAELLKDVSDDYNQTNAQNYTPLELAKALKKDDLVKTLEEFANEARKFNPK